MKRLLAAVLAAVMMTAMTVPAFAWRWEIQQSGEWMVVLDNGSYATNQWINDNGTYYFVGPDGIMLRNNYTPDGYWVGASGAWEPRWGKRSDITVPYTGGAYDGSIYSYKFESETYGSGVEHWSMDEYAFGSRTGHYELYPLGGFCFEMMDIYSGTTLGYVSVSPDRGTVYVSCGGQTYRAVY